METVIVDCAMKFQAWLDQKPTIVFGAVTLRELLQKNGLDTNKTPISYYGYPVKLGNFDFGFYLE